MYYASVLGEIWPKKNFLTHVDNNFFNPCIFHFLLNLVTPLVDSATVWRQTMFFTRVLALLGTKPCYLRWFWRSTELISDALEQNMGILSRRFALLFFVFSPLSSLFRFLVFCSSSKVLPPWSGRKNEFLHIQTYTFYYCFFRPVRSQILCHLPRALKFSKRLIILCKNMGKPMWH